MKKILTYTLCLPVIFAIYLILFGFIPMLYNNTYGTLTSISNLSFHFLNIVFYGLTLCLIYIICSGKINKYVFIVSGSIATIMTYFNFTFVANSFFHKNDLYLSIFKSAGGSGFFFQYALIMILSLAFVYSLGALFFFPKKIIKYLFIVFMTGFYIFFYFAHEYVVKDAFSDWSKNNSVVISNILNTITTFDTKTLTMCENVGYKCSFVKNEEEFDTTIPVRNLGNNARKITPDLEEISLEHSKGIAELKQRIETFMDSNKNEDFFSHKDLEYLRAFSFGLKKVDGKILVLEDNRVLCTGLDMYLLYITLMTILFLSVWGFILTAVYKIHLKFKVIKENDLS